RNFVWLKRKLPLALKKRIVQLHIEGIDFVEESKRFYPQGELASPVLGFAGIDNQGLAGIEFSYDNQLRGERGDLLVMKDALGYQIPLTKEFLKKPVPGKNIVLTIDNIIQSIVEEELSRALEEEKAKSAEALFMNPQNGEIIALANKPDYNPNHYLDYTPFERKNRLIQSIYEPGSTFKAVTAAVLLEEKLVNMQESIYCGTFTIANHTFYDWKKFNKDLTFSQIIQDSSDVGTIKLAQRMEEELFYRYICLAGFGKKTGIELPGEEKGIVRPPSSWSSIDLPCISIGQGIAVTPLQMVVALSSLINGGELLKPYIVKYISTPEGKIIIKNNSHLLRKIISSSTSRKMRRLLKKVVEGGTGTEAGIEGYTMGGKTGTAQIPLSNGKGYIQNRYIASFMGFTPVDSPEIVGIVIIKESTGGYWGGEIAAPVFGRIMKRILPYLNILPEKSRWVKQPEN
ncbi:MAG: penicillin-binding transpeptidase domain-containing protein, partial [Candidatus Aerophobetes bacterium]|nr:penicillin-binding transpeptidase domain-containing protein [Candidatus Aerophobetes bacterium]